MIHALFSSFGLNVKSWRNLGRWSAGGN